MPAPGFLPDYRCKPDAIAFRLMFSDKAEPPRRAGIKLKQGGPMDRRVRILEWALAIIGLLLLAAAARADEGDDLYTVGASHYAAGRWDLAATEFQSLLSRHPQHARATEAEFFLGESLSQSHHYREAAEAYARLLNQKPP